MIYCAIWSIGGLPPFQTLSDLNIRDVRGPLRPVPAEASCTSPKVIHQAVPRDIKIGLVHHISELDNLDRST